MAGQYSELVQRMNQMAGVNLPVENKPISPLIQKMNEMAGVESFKPARFVGEQLGKGALQLSDALKFLGANKAAQLAEMGLSPIEIEEILGKGHEKAASEYAQELRLNTQAEDTALKRIAGHGLRALPSGILGIGAGVVPALGMAGAAGIGSGVLQEAGVPALPADIVAGLGTAALPSLGRAVGKGASRIWSGASAEMTPKLSAAEKRVAAYLREAVGEENIPEVAERLKSYAPYKSGYTPTTAEIAQNPSLAMIHRGEEGIPGAGISERMGEGANILNERLAAMTGESPELAVSEAVAQRLNALERQKQQAIESVGKRAHPEEGGRATRHAVEEELEEATKIRREASRPHYLKMENDLTRDTASGIRSFLKKQEEKVAGDLKSDLKSIIRDITPKMSIPEKSAWKSYQENIKNMREKGYSKKAIQEYINTARPENTPYPTVAKLSAVRRDLNGKINEFYQSGNKARAQNLERAVEALDKDLGKYPAQKLADIEYRKYSPRVNEIEENPTLKKMLKERRGQEQLTDSRVANLFLKSGKESLDDAKALVKTVGYKKESLKPLKETMNDYALDYITDRKTGNVISHKLEQLKDNHPGIEYIYPELFETKLKNVNNAQVNANRYYRDAAAKAAVEYNEHLGEYTSKTGSRLSNELFSHDSYKNIKDLKKSISHDAEAMEGLRRLSVDKFYNSIQNASIEGKYRTLSYDKMRRFLNQHKKGMEEVLTPEQITFLNEFEQIMHGRNQAATLGVEKGSPSAQRLRTHEAFKSKISPKFVPAKLRGFFNSWAESYTQKHLDILHKVLLDKDYAHTLMTHEFKNQAEFNKFMNDIAKTRISAILAQRPERKENDNI